MNWFHKTHACMIVVAHEHTLYDDMDKTNPMYSIAFAKGCHEMLTFFLRFTSFPETPAFPRKLVTDEPRPSSGLACWRGVASVLGGPHPSETCLG